MRSVQFVVDPSEKEGEKSGQANSKSKKGVQSCESYSHTCHIETESSKPKSQIQALVPINMYYPTPRPGRWGDERTEGS